MGILNSIFGRPNSPWNEVLQNTNVETETKFIIKKFFIADNISLEKYTLNESAFSIYNSFQKYFADNLPATASLEFAANPFNRGMAIPDWFVIAYPDVIKWMFENNGSVETLYKKPYVTDDGPALVFYRAVIQKYLYSGNKLECI